MRQSKGREGNSGDLSETATLSPRYEWEARMPTCDTAAGHKDAVAASRKSMNVFFVFEHLSQRVLLYIKGICTAPTTYSGHTSDP